MARTYTRLSLAEGSWQSNFVAIPAEFAQAVRSSPDFASQGVVAFRVNWTGTKEGSGETESKECYVGWNGAIARGPYIHVPDRLSELTGLAAALGESRSRGGNGLIVNVYAVKNCEIARRVDVEPETFEDWEVLERHAGFVETQMLSQICVVYPNQKFCVWVANVPVKLIVKSGLTGPCAKMANETEVVVAPKPRPQQQQQQPTTIGGSSQPVNKNSDAPRAKPVTLRVQPVDDMYNGTVLVSRSTLELMRTVAEWDVLGADNNNVGLMGGQALTASSRDLVLCRVADASTEDGPVFSVRISDRIAHGHVGLSRAARRLGVKPFAKTSLIPVASSIPVTKLVTPQSITLRRIVFPSLSSPELLPSDVDSLSAKVQTSLNSEFTMLSVGAWIAVDGVLFKLTNPQPSGPAKFWLFSRDNAPQQWVLGEDLSVNPSSSPSSASVEEKEELATEVAEDADIETDLLDSEWTLETMGGPCRKAGEELREHLVPLLSTSGSANRVRLGTSPTGGSYLYGPRGCGKSTVIRALARTLGEDVNFLTFVVRLDCAAMKGGKRSAIQKKMERAVHLAQSRSPSLVVFDDLDALLPQPSNPGEEDAQTVWLSEFLEGLMAETRARFERFERVALDAIDQGKLDFGDVMNWNRHAVSFMATGRAKKSLRAALLRIGCFERKVEMPVLDLGGRQSVLRALLNRRGLSEEVDEDEVEDVATKAEGYTAADLDTLVERAVHKKASLMLVDDEGDEEGKQGEEASPPSSKSGLLRAAIEGFTPSSLRGVKLAKSDTAWSDVGGLESVRDVLKETLELPFQFAELYDRSPQKLASGILLYGPPGCGKTLLAGAVASECGLNFISVKGPEVLNKYIGASEQAIRDLFARAASVTPCIIFFDEFDAVAPRRGSDSTGVTDRVVNQLLTFLDGVESRKGVYVMAATSRPDLVDPALLRPGRLDKQLYCGFPDEKERLSILHAIAGKLKLSKEAREDTLPEIARSGLELTGADLQALMATAQLLAVHDESVEITSKHLERAFVDTRPSVSREDRLRFEKIYRQFRGDREPPSVPGDGSGFFSETAKQKVALM